MSTSGSQGEEQEQKGRVSSAAEAKPATISSSALATMSASATTTSTTAQTASASARIISGSVGSLITALAVTPLEVVKVHLQNARPTTTTAPPTTTTTTTIPTNVTLCPKGCGTFILNNGLFDCVLPKSSVPYFDEFGNLKRVEIPPKPPATTIKRQRRSLGTFGMIRRIFLKDGFQGIYAGLGPTLVMGIPSTAFYYSVYDEFVNKLRTNPQIVESSINPYVPLFAGSSARLLSTMLTAPLELIRTRQASAVGEGKLHLQQSMIQEFQSIVRVEGCGALYKGLAPTLWRDVPFSGIYWLSLEQFKQFYESLLFPDHNNNHQSPMQQAGVSFLSGASAGMVAAACTTPFDVVKTRQQAVTETMESVATRTEITPVVANCTTCCNHDGQVVYRATTTAVTENKPPASVFAYMRTIYETEGVTGLWRGNQTRMIKVAPSCAIMITCYEFGKRMLQQQQQQQQD